MPTTPTYRNRGLLLMGSLLLLGVITGYVWGRMSGYEQGEADTIRAIEQKLTEPEQERVVIETSTIVLPYKRFRGRNQVILHL